MDAPRGMGRSLFAAVLLMLGGVLGVIYGIAAISNSHFFTHDAHYVFGSLRTWGWVTLIIGVVELLAAFSLFSGGTWGRYFAIFVGCLAALDSLLAIPAYPFLALATFALSLWIIHGLAIYRGPDGAEEAYYESASVARSAPPPGTVPGSMAGTPRS